MTVQLLPCPFCNGAPEPLYREVPFSRWRFRVGCKICGAEGGAEASSLEAARMWNVRSTEIPSQDGGAAT